MASIFSLARGLCRVGSNIKVSRRIKFSRISRRMKPVVFFITLELVSWFRCDLLRLYYCKAGEIVVGGQRAAADPQRLDD